MAQHAAALQADINAAGMGDPRIPVDQDLVMREVQRERDELRAEVARQQHSIDNIAQANVELSAERDRLRAFLKYVYGVAQDHDDLQLMAEIDKVLER